MIRGYFSIETGRRRPFIDAVFQFPTLDTSLEIPVLIDTGADRTILSPLDTIRLALELGIDFATFDKGHPSTGVGGQTNTRVTNILLRLNDFVTPLEIAILEPSSSRRISSIPSLLGRDIISRFGLFIDERTDQVLLLEPNEVDGLALPH